MHDKTPQPMADGYRIPQRFGVAASLGLLTLFSLLFAGLRSFGAPPALYLFLSIQAVVVCLVQMTFGAAARWASTLVGCVFLPAWVWILVALESHLLPPKFTSSWVDLPAAIFFGGLLGYCTGTVLAGVFLVIDVGATLAERAARWRARWR